MPTHPAPLPVPPLAEPSPLAQSALRRAITAATRMPETEAVALALQGARVPAPMADRIDQRARTLAGNLRQREAGAGRAGLVQNLLQEYALSSEEGVALMCLAEALLRIPDTATRDQLIRDKISRGRWQRHLGQSPSLFVNAATWGLLITGRLVTTHSEAGLSSAIGKFIAAGGEPLIRKGVDLAMRMMGEQFVTGETIEEAIRNGEERERQGFRYSYDMLGEAALTARDAQRYLRDYEHAIGVIGKASGGRGIIDGPGISIKLSALHPRYARAQRERVMAELYPVVLRLCALAKRHDIGLNIDAEESERLEISLDLLERLATEPQLARWDGLGFVIQAYQKRSAFVIDHVIDLARRAGRRLMIRLVKGAYWDSEIKRAQAEGQDGYPVFTRKVYTDASYLACARRLLAAPDAVYPQFATHNAQTLAAIYEMAGPQAYAPGQYEFQCLHGMGEPLYEQVVGAATAGGPARPCRIYAPVGTHETLLAYLVRRLLENGANTSFVHRIADETIAIDELVRDPVVLIEQMARDEGVPGAPHPAIALPRDLYGPSRRNSAGLDLNNEDTLARLGSELTRDARVAWGAGPMLALDDAAGGDDPASPAPAGRQDIRNPCDHGDVVGQVRDTDAAQVEAALAASVAGARQWSAAPVAERARILARAADDLEAAAPRLMGLLMREAGKSAANAVSEVREAVDFLRYYGSQARALLDPARHRPLGTVTCISPWNFPLAIFLGQVGAALAAGNAVIAKPAEQTPLIAAEAVRLLRAAGVPKAALQLAPGPGAVVGAALVADPRTQGVLFTGSTEVARILQRGLAGRLDASGRPVPLVAETGGQNAMIVDSSALAEQVVSDVIASAFDSAGQRCSALRVLCVQEDVADPILEMLLGAMAELRVGDPRSLATDVGPVIDGEARAGIEAHIEAMRARGHRVHQVAAQSVHPLSAGTFVLPTVIEIDSIAQLGREVFGPVLHFVRYPREELAGLLAEINATGYGLTLGLHTRIEETIDQVVAGAHAGNLYVNRNMIGAVVGVQPFGGEGLSGTGPKAGGPLYLFRLLGGQPGDALARVTSALHDAYAAAAAPSETGASGAIAAPGAPSPSGAPDAPGAALAALVDWAQASMGPTLAQACARLGREVGTLDTFTLAGPTGERNTYRIEPRAATLCLARDDSDRILQLAAVLAVGGRAIWPADRAALLQRLPAMVRERVIVARDWASGDVRFDAVLLHGTEDELLEVQRRLCGRDGPIIGIERLAPGDTAIRLERLVIERALSVNTAAAGGNASLMTIG